jgi:hypothetical protein
MNMSAHGPIHGCRSLPLLFAKLLKDDGPGHVDRYSRVNVSYRTNGVLGV